jgi:hypothetical protein
MCAIEHKEADNRAFSRQCHPDKYEQVHIFLPRLMRESSHPSCGELSYEVKTTVEKVIGPRNH